VTSALIISAAVLLGPALGGVSGPAGEAGAAGIGRAGHSSTGRLSFQATGYFHVAQGSDGRWWLVTPTGQPFYSTGIDHVSAAPDTDQVTGQCPYCETIDNEYPDPDDPGTLDTQAWANATVSRLRSWGFNTIGPFSDVSTFASKMAYTVQLSMASGDDWFAASFKQHADEVAATQVAPLADDPNLIGYFTDSELNWGPNESSNQTLLQDYLALPVGSPGHAVAEKYVGNPNGFTYALALRYFQVTTAAIRKYDPHHLILGVKAESNDVPPQLLKAARHYVNVFSIDDYQLLPGLAAIAPKIWPEYLPVESNFANFEQYVKRPIMIAEYSFRSVTALTPSTVPWIYPTYPTQTKRAQAYTKYIGTVYQSAPWVVGDDWFEYVDEPYNGRTGDGENSNFGVVNVDNQPYEPLVDAMTLMHTATPEAAVATGRQCDSWTSGASGTSCDARISKAAAEPLTIPTPPSLSGAYLDEAYDESVVAGGGQPPYHFQLERGALPPGLGLDPSTGAISGEPTSDGTFHFVVGVTDSARKAATVDRAFSLAVTPGPLSITTSSLRAATVGTSYRARLRAQGGVPPYTWSITGGTALPPGLSLTSRDGEELVTGTPDRAGSFTVKLKVRDSDHPVHSATATLSLGVAPAG
jgi:hypothetical protein